MRESAFQFMNPFLTKLDFEFNKDFDPDLDFELKRTMTNDVLRSPDHNRAMATLTVKVFAENNEPFNIEISYSSEFMWDDDVDEEVVNSFLEINSSVILLSYIRPIVSFITDASPLPGYNIPFIDFSEIKS